MASTVPSIMSHSGFVMVQRRYHIPFLKRFNPKEDLPSWLTIGRETKQVLPLYIQWNKGEVDVNAYTCGCKGNPECPGWDMNAFDFLSFTGEDRDLWNSSFYFSEVVWLLRIARNTRKGEHLPSPFFFIVEGNNCNHLLLRIRRNQGRGFTIESSREIGYHTMVPRRLPLFLPSLTY